jgi:DNA-directed RNA polymerase subunit beta'
MKRNVKGLLEHLTGKTTPKSSFFQKKIMKRQQDISGRGTIAPDGSLGMDEIGLPEDMLWGMYGKFIIGRLVRRGFNAVRAKEMVEEKHPAARDALMAELKERPVMVNRAPTLHRYGFVGANPVPVAGKTIRVNPFIEQGMNADYDGDTFQIHVPVLPAAVAEVKGMTLSNLLFSDREKNSLMVAPRMEAMLGVHLATKAEAAPNAKTHNFKTKEDALAAYKRGDITLNTKIEVGP